MVRIAASVVRLNSIWKQREEADRRDRVVQRRQHRADAELPFEAEPDVDGDRDQREHGRDHAGADQLVADRRARPPRCGGIRSLSPSACLDRCRPPVICALSPPGWRGRRISTSSGAAEILQRDLAECEPVELRAHRGEIGRALRRARLDQRAAGEIDAVIEAVRRRNSTIDADGQHRPRTRSRACASA